MPVTEVTSRWESGALDFQNNSGESAINIAAELVSLGKGLKLTPYAATATADGTTTGTIPTGASFVSVTSAGANNIVILPAPVPGTIVLLHVGANGFELRSSAPATVAINGGTGANAESPIPANTLVFMVCTTATTWQGWDLTAATLAGVEAAA